MYVIPFVIDENYNFKLASFFFRSRNILSGHFNFEHFSTEVYYILFYLFVVDYSFTSK